MKLTKEQQGLIDTIKDRQGSCGFVSDCTEIPCPLYDWCAVHNAIRDGQEKYDKVLAKIKSLKL